MPCCSNLWCESCVAFIGEIGRENRFFLRRNPPRSFSVSRKMPNRVAKAKLSSLDWASFVLRLGVFRPSIRHVSRCGMRYLKLQNSPVNCKYLMVRLLRIFCENRIFAPNHLLVEKKHVVFTIVCCIFSAPMRIAPQPLPHGAVARWGVLGIKEPFSPLGFLGFLYAHPFQLAPKNVIFAKHSPSVAV